MYKPLVALAILGAMSVSATAQTVPAADPAQTAPAADQAQPAKPQTVKKRVCQVIEDDNPYSRLGSRKICKTVDVPVQQQGSGAASGQQAPAPEQQTGNNL